jgi:pimeloyl-ACP methyl ester carboxylesterase
MPRVRVDGIEIAYEVRGEGTPLLCLMGLGTNRRAWVAQVPFLSRRMMLLLPDNRGVGESDKPAGPYTTRRMAEDALALVDAMELARVHVLGVSMGGAVAQELALLAPERVRSLVLACTFGKAGRGFRALAEETARSLGASGADALAAARDAAARAGPRRIAEAMMPLLFAPGFWERAPAEIRREMIAAFAEGFSAEGLLGQLAAVLSHDAISRLANVRAPTLVLHGDADRLVPLHHGERLAAAVPGAQLRVIAGGAHGFFAEQPEEFNAAVTDWVEAVEEESAEEEAAEVVRIPIDGTLDLHTFRPAEVKDLLCEYIDACRTRGILEIRVIHGKGTGALRRTVHAVLEKHPAVVEFALGDARSGGWGATRVVLRAGA